MQEQSNILKELESMGSPLAKMSREMPYVLPEGYFEHLPAQVLAGAMEKDVTGLLPKELPFKVPEGYFDQLPGELLNVIKKEEAGKTKVIPLGRNVWYKTRMAAAAVLLVLMSAGLFAVLNREQSFDSKLASIPEETVSEYIQEHIDEFDSHMIESSMSITSAEPASPSQLTEEEITDYLNETGWQ